MMRFVANTQAPELGKMWEGDLKTKKEQAVADKKAKAESEAKITDAKLKLAIEKDLAKYKAELDSGKLTFNKEVGIWNPLTGQVVKKASDMGIETDDKKSLPYEGLVKHIAIKNGKEQVEKTFLPLLNDEDGINKIKSLWIPNMEKLSPELQKYRNAYLNAAEAVIRAESGAAVPDPEIKRMALRAAPSLNDSSETVKLKITNLYKRLNDTYNATRELYKTGETPSQVSVVGRNADGSLALSNGLSISEEDAIKQNIPKGY